MTLLETIFGELGISQYLDEFLEQGFDSWDTILDITESDLDALGVKLGHRRKLQRRIANYRGIAPDVSLTSPTRTSIEDGRGDGNRAETVRPDNNSRLAPVVMKRKYRRHPKPDENAPERPPSAYVLFSNKMREDLKGQNLTFTEIAKLVGENWQNLGRAEKEPFERQANEAKERYAHDLARYKQTADYKKYNEYLHEFRKRQAAQTQEKDAAKRLKLDADSVRGSSTSAGPGTTTSGTGSGSESQHGSEPPPSRQQRLGSIASLSTGASYADDPVTSPGVLTNEEPIYARRRGLSSPQSRDLATPSINPRSGWVDGQLIHGDHPATGLPWLDSRGALTQTPQSFESMTGSVHPGRSRHSSQANSSLRTSRSSASTSGSTSVSQHPSLHHEQSSSASSTSTSPYHPRTPNDTSLPIHALLSSKTKDSQPLYMQAPIPRPQAPSDREAPQRGSFHSSPHYNSNGIAGFFPGSQPPQPPQPPRPPRPPLSHPFPPQPHQDLVPSSERNPASAPRQTNVGGEGLDGISALLRAREIVDRRS